MVDDELLFEDPFASQTAIVQWPHCARCGAACNKVNRPLCTDCEHNAFEKAESYGGSADEILNRYAGYKSLTRSLNVQATF